MKMDKNKMNNLFSITLSGITGFALGAIMISNNVRNPSYDKISNENYILREKVADLEVQNIFLSDILFGQTLNELKKQYKLKGRDSENLPDKRLLYREDPVTPALPYFSELESKL